MLDYLSSCFNSGVTYIHNQEGRLKAIALFCNDQLKHSSARFQQKRN